MNIWDWLFGGDPRGDLIEAVLNSIYEPVQPDMVIQGYYDQLSIFATIAAILILCELIVRLVRAAKSENSAANELKQLLYSALFLFGLVGTLPGLLGSFQIGFNSLGSFIATAFIGSEGTQEITRVLLGMSDNPALNTFLGLIQILLVAIFGISVLLIPACMSTSAFLMVMGVSMRWIGDIGETILRFSLFVTTFAILGPGVYMVFLGILVGFSRDSSPENSVHRALLNTGIFLLAAILTIGILAMFKNRIKATVSGAVKATQHGYSKLRGGYQKVTGSGKQQVKESVDARKRRIDKEASNRSSEQSENGSRSERLRKLAAAAGRIAVRSKTYPGAIRAAYVEGRKLKQDRLSSTASRSRSRLTHLSSSKQANQARTRSRSGQSTRPASVQPPAPQRQHTQQPQANPSPRERSVKPRPATPKPSQRPLRPSGRTNRPR